jgi:hypothetical protein
LNNITKLKPTIMNRAPTPRVASANHMGLDQSDNSGLAAETAACEGTYWVYADSSTMAMSMFSRVRPWECSCMRQTEGNLVVSQGLSKRRTSPLLLRDSATCALRVALMAMSMALTLRFRILWQPSAVLTRSKRSWIPCLTLSATHSFAPSPPAVTAISDSSYALYSAVTSLMASPSICCCFSDGKSHIFFTRLAGFLGPNAMSFGASFPTMPPALRAMDTVIAVSPFLALLSSSTALSRGTFLGIVHVCIYTMSSDVSTLCIYTHSISCVQQHIYTDDFVIIYGTT